MLSSWDNLKPGDIITVKRVYAKRAFRIRVTAVEPFSTSGSYATVTGKRLTAAGQPSKRRTQLGHSPGERTELVCLDDITEHTEATK